MIYCRVTQLLMGPAEEDEEGIGVIVALKWRMIHSMKDVDDIILAFLVQQ